MLDRLGYLIRKRTISLIAVTGAAAMLLALMPAASALADTRGNQPDVWACGALRDIPSQWTAVPGGFCGGGWGYSYVLTSPSVNHFATWTFGGGIHIGTAGSLQVEAWIPSFGAGQLTAYYYQGCGSSRWIYIGQLFQENDSGWYTPGAIPLGQNQSLCAIREQNTGNQTLYMAEDALGFTIK